MLVVAYALQLYRQTHSAQESADEADLPPPPAGDVHLPLASWLSWIPSQLHPLLRNLVVHALRLGPRPRHVAFIMDGNRRSARKRNLPVRVGHEEGFEALKRVLSFLLKLDIPHVTVYAFSIENFNRDPGEVDALLDMARVRLVEICQHGYGLLILARLGSCAILTQNLLLQRTTATAWSPDPCHRSPRSFAAGRSSFLCRGGSPNRRQHSVRSLFGTLQHRMS